jgi:hypothetical protein
LSRCNLLDGHALARALGGCEDRASARKKKQRWQRRGTGKQYVQILYQIAMVYQVTKNKLA